MDQLNYEGKNQILQGQQEQKVPKKGKKKKKHRFLKFLLLVLLVVLAYKGSKVLCNKIAYEQLEKTGVDYPFVFNNEMDSMWYVTDNFTVPTSYINAKNKEIKVDWTSSSKAITFDNGNAVVTRPVGGVKTVIVTQTHKWLWGKASIQYELNVIPTKVQTVDQIDVVTIEELQNKMYDREMKAVLYEDDSLNYMIGDFKDTVICSVEDACVVLEAYREQFGVDEELIFKINKVTDSSKSTNYIFDVFYNEIKLGNCNANITVDKETSEMVKIDINAKTKVENITLNEKENDYETIIDEYIKQYDESHKENEKVIVKNKKVIMGETIVANYSILYDTGEYYIIQIDANTGEVLEYYCDEIFVENRTATTATGETEYGKTVTVDTSYYNDLLQIEVMYDIGRNIHTYDNKGWFGLYKNALKEDAGILEFVAGIVNYHASNVLNFEIEVNDSKIENKIAAQSQYNITKAYDWYKDNFNLKSYDGKGAPVVLVIGHGASSDNASWVGDEKTFRVNPVSKFKYSLSASPELMAHEYTHAVFGSKAVDFEGESPVEYSGINEAYADIFGCLSTNSKDWIMGRNEFTDGTKVCVRDIGNINRDGIDSELKLYNGNVYPETYKGEKWVEEEHAISVILSHVAYEMSKSELFTNAEVSKIWFHSMDYGYSNDSTYLTVREYVVEAAKELNSTKEQILFIENAFWEVGIGEEPNIIETESKAVEGDAILDDTKVHRYIVFMSPVGVVLGKSEIYIFQESDGMSKQECNELQEELTNRIRKRLGKDFENLDNIKVDYRQVKPWAMDYIYEFLSETEANLEDMMLEGMGTDKEKADEHSKAIVKFLMDIGFVWETKYCTAYDFYDDFGLIE